MSAVLLSTGMKIVDDELQSIQRQLSAILGHNQFGKYTWLLEAFLGGRLGKPEFEIALRTLLTIKKSDKKYDQRHDQQLSTTKSLYELHNNYIGLVLEKLSRVEGQVLEEWRRTREEQPHRESARLLLSNIIFTTTDEQFFKDATIRTSIIDEQNREREEEQTRIAHQFRLELNANEKNLGRPLLAFVSKRLPDSVALKAQLVAWLRAYGLETSGAEDEELVTLLQQALIHYLERRLERGTTINPPTISLASLT